MSIQQLLWGEGAAVLLAALFGALEWVRLRNSVRAMLEAGRVWGHMAISLLAFWMALHDLPSVVRVAIALLMPLMSALVMNNLYVFLGRRWPAASS